MGKVRNIILILLVMWEIIKMEKKMGVDLLNGLFQKNKKSKMHKHNSKLD